MSKHHGIKVQSITVNDTTFAVYVEGTGTFAAYVPDDPDDAPPVKRSATFEGLKQQLALASRAHRITIAVPFERLNGDGTTTPMVCTGVHANGNYLVTENPDGPKAHRQQLHAYELRQPASFVRVLTPNERDTWKAVCESRRATERQAEKLRTRAAINLVLDVGQALTAAREQKEKA